VRTIRDIDEKGLDLRLWCFGCARGSTVEGSIWRRFEARGWPLDLQAARCHFRCKECRSTENILIVPASRPLPPVEEPISWEREVMRFFFQSRRAAKKRR
jgi:hypothetical protein